MMAVQSTTSVSGVAWSTVRAEVMAPQAAYMWRSAVLRTRLRWGPQQPQRRSCVWSMVPWWRRRRDVQAASNLEKVC